MSTQAPETIVMAGAAVPRADIEDALCEAFKEAVVEWCARPAGKKGSFNSTLFKKLKAGDLARGTNYAANIAREVPIVFGGVAGAAGQTAASLVRGGATGPAGAMAGILHEGYVTGSRWITGGASAWLSGANQVAGRGVMSAFALGMDPAAKAATIANLRNISGAWNRFPDGLIPPRQIIEIKGPGDTYDRGQKRDYDKFSQPGKPIEPDCVKCDAPCVNDPEAPNDGCT
jgi:hypothetical protein